MMKIINKCYLGLGSNLGNKYDNLTKARKLIAENIGNIVEESTTIETKAWGNTNQDHFINQVILIESTFSAKEILKICNTIEANMGRTRTIHWGPRIIDIDILFYNDCIIDSKELTIPHPFIQEREFVLISLNEIAADFIHPKIKKTIKLLLQELTSQKE